MSASAKETTCLVCSAPAANHLHYGGVCCLSCKAFFRRAIQEGTFERFICRVADECAVDGKARKHCQKCRFRKCRR